MTTTACFLNYAQALYTDWLHFKKCPNVTNQCTITRLVSPINVQCLPIYIGKHCTLIGYISSWKKSPNVTNQCTMLAQRYGQALYIDWLQKQDFFLDFFGRVTRLVTNQCTMLALIYRQALYTNWLFKHVSRLDHKHCTLISYICHIVKLFNVTNQCTML